MLFFNVKSATKIVANCKRNVIGLLLQHSHSRVETRPRLLVASQSRQNRRPLRASHSRLHLSPLTQVNGKSLIDKLKSFFRMPKRQPDVRSQTEPYRKTRPVTGLTFISNGWKNIGKSSLRVVHSEIERREIVHRCAHIRRTSPLFVKRIDTFHIVKRLLEKSFSLTYNPQSVQTLRNQRHLPNLFTFQQSIHPELIRLVETALIEKVVCHICHHAGILAGLRLLGENHQRVHILLVEKCLHQTIGNFCLCRATGRTPLPIERVRLVRRSSRRSPPRRKIYAG